MKTITVFLLASGLLFMSALRADFEAPDSNSARRQNDRDEIKAREKKLQMRIIQGITKGQLTRLELKKIKKLQKKIARLERSFKNDGRLDIKERRILAGKLDQMNRIINLYQRNNEYLQARRIQEKFKQESLPAKEAEKVYPSLDQRENLKRFRNVR